MKLKRIRGYDFIIEFEGLLETKFERNLFTASLRNYCSHGNPIRFHNFAYSMRELLLHVIERKAPDDAVKKAVWYERESDSYEVTRRQKLKYCSQRYLADEYLGELLLEDLNATIKAYLKNFQFLNKYTHITEKHFNVSPKVFFQDMKDVVEKSKEIIEGLYEMEQLIRDHLEDKIQDPVFAAVINAQPNELVILANHVFIEEVIPEGLEITYLEENGITVQVEGTINVTQSYGPKEDICEISSSYSFKIPVQVSAKDPNNIEINPNDLEVDTSSWYE